MNIFNSLGSNYNLNFVLKALFAKDDNQYSQDLKTFLEKKYSGKAILVYKGREAIALALNILKLPKDSKVAINGFTCFAVYKAIDNAGYATELLDLDNSEESANANLSFRAIRQLAESRGISLKEISRQARNDKGKSLDLNFSANELLKAVKQNPKIKVVIIQNTLGYPCDIEKIVKVCRENNLILIEDLAHSIGTTYANGKEAGTIGDFVVLSFSQDKIIDAVSGGALIIRNKKYLKNVIPSAAEESPAPKQQLLDRLYPLFTFKIRKTYPIGIGKLIHFILKSLNLLSEPMNENFYEKYNLPNWYCYLAMDCFKNLKKKLEHRRTIATIYNSMLDKKITSSFINQNIRLSSNLRYPIFVDNRKNLISYLKKEGVYVSDIWYDSVSHKLPNCRLAAEKILNLPTHKNVSENDAIKIAQKINYFILRASLAKPKAKRDESRSTLANSSRLTPFARTITSEEIWESFLSSHPEANFLQSWYWGEFYNNLGNIIQRTGFYSGDKLIGVMLSIVENAKRGKHLIVPGGPIIDWATSGVVNCFVEEIKKIAKDNKCVFVRVRPQLVSSQFSKNLFKKNGFINAPMHLHAELTSQLDITKAEETLLAQMRKTTRYEIKKAISLGIRVTGYQDLSLIKEFYDLQLFTARRQKFVPFSFEFLNEQFKVFSQKNKALLYKATLNNKLLAEAIIIFYGKEAVYHYGASTDEGRKYPGAYLIQWEAILEAKRRACMRYNFWGVAPLTSSEHRFSGLSLFKRGFGGQDVEYLHAQDLIINYPKYLLNYAIESIRKRIRNV